MFCTHCGTNLKDSANFCSKCGKNVSNSLVAAEPTKKNEEGTQEKININSLTSEGVKVTSTELPKNKPLGTAWFKSWNYFLLPLGVLSWLTIAFVSASRNTNLSIFSSFYTILLLMLIYGLHKREDWAWYLNWFQIVSGPVMGLVNIIFFVPKSDNYSTLIVELVFMFSLWLWANYVYWTKRKTLFLNHGDLNIELPTGTKSIPESDPSVEQVVKMQKEVNALSENSEIFKKPQIEEIPIHHQNESREFMWAILFTLIIVGIFLLNYYNTPIKYSTTPVSNDTTATQVQQATNAIQPATQNTQPAIESLKPAPPIDKRPTIQVDGFTWRIAKTFHTRNGIIHVLDADHYFSLNQLNHVIEVSDTLITNDKNLSDFWEIEKIAKRDNGDVDVVAYGEAGAAGDSKQLMALSIMPNKQVRFSIQDVESPEINFKVDTGVMPDIEETTLGTMVRLGWKDGKKQIAYLKGGNITLDFEDNVTPTKRDYENCEYAANALDECSEHVRNCDISQLKLDSFSQFTQRMVAHIKDAPFFNTNAFAQACQAACVTNIKPTPEQFAKDICGFS